MIVRGGVAGRLEDGKGGAGCLKERGGGARSYEDEEQDFLEVYEEKVY